MEKQNQSVTGLFSPEEYEELVAQAEAIFQNSQSADKVIQALAGPIIDAFEQEEKTKRREAQQKGVAAARSRGVHLGRPRREAPDNFPLVLRQYLDGNLTAAMAASLCGVAVSTFYRMKREALEAPNEQAETPYRG